MITPKLWKLLSKRRIVLVEKRPQLLLMAYSVAFGGIGILLTHFLYQQPSPTEATGDFSWFRFIAMTLFLVLLFASYLYFGLVLTNRMVGPLNRMQRHMRDMAKREGDYRFVFREKDFFPELEEAYNLLLASIQEQEKGRKEK